METRRWINQSQPQTLVIGTFLLYFNAVFTLVLGGDSAGLVLSGLVKLGLDYSGWLDNLVKIGLGLGFAAGGYLIANERKWGYRLGIAVAAIPLAATLVLVVLPEINNIPQVSLGDLDLVSVLFDVALFALLVHPQSRDYERIWFK